MSIWSWEIAIFCCWLSEPYKDLSISRTRRLHPFPNTDSIYWALATFFLVPRSNGIPVAIWSSNVAGKSRGTYPPYPHCWERSVNMVLGWWTIPNSNHTKSQNQYPFPQKIHIVNLVGGIPTPLPFPTEWKVIIQPCSHQPDGIPHFLNIPWWTPASTRPKTSCTSRRLRKPPPMATAKVVLW